MSRATAVLTPGRANRRFVLLAVVLGLLGAILVYMAFSRDSSTSTGAGSAAGGDIAVVVAQLDIPARTRITQAMLDVRFVSENNRSALAFEDPNLVVGKVTRFPVAANEQVLSSKIISLAPGSSAGSRSLAFTIPTGKRGFAVSTTDLATAGGLILPGDYVDIVVLYDVEFTSRSGQTETEADYLVQTLYQNVEVLAVAQTVVDVVPEAGPATNGQRVRNSEAKPLPGAATVTLALTPEQVQRLYSAESNGKVRFSLRPFGDAEERPIDFFTELELLPQNIPSPFSR